MYPITPLPGLAWHAMAWRMHACMQMVESLSHLAIASDLRATVQRAYVDTLRKQDVALRHVCSDFEPTKYVQVSAQRLQRRPARSPLPPYHGMRPCTCGALACLPHRWVELRCTLHAWHMAHGGGGKQLMSTVLMRGRGVAVRAGAGRLHAAGPGRQGRGRACGAGLQGRGGGRDVQGGARAAAHQAQVSRPASQLRACVHACMGRGGATAH